MRMARCDAQGNFAVNELPPGRYLVSAIVTWSVAGRFQGGKLERAVVVEAGQTAKVLLSDTDRR